LLFISIVGAYLNDLKITGTVKKSSPYTSSYFGKSYFIKDGWISIV